MVFNIINILFGSLLVFLFMLGDKNHFYGIYGAVLFGMAICMLLYYINEYISNRKLATFGFRPSYICLLGLVVVNLQFIIDYTIGFSMLSTTTRLPWASFYADKSLFAGILFIIVFLIGNSNCKTGFRGGNVKRKAIDLRPWVIISIAVFLLFLVNIDIQAFITGAVYKLSGAAYSIHGISDSFERIYGICVVAVFAIYTMNMQQEKSNGATLKEFVKGMPLLFWCTFAFYILLKLFSGDRGPVLYNSLIVIYSYLLCSRKTIKMKHALVLIVIGALGITFLSVFRSRSSDMPISEKISESILRLGEINTESDRTVFAYTRELAGSAKCNFIAIKDIDQGITDLSYGRYTLLTALSSLPGMKRDYISALGFKPYEISSAEYLTVSFSGTTFYSYGVGSSVLGEAYLEFGLLGIIIFAALCGIIFKKTDCAYMNGSYSVPMLIIILWLSSRAIYIPRASFAMTLGQIIYALSFYYLFYFIIYFSGVFKRSVKSACLRIKESNKIEK